MVAQPLSDTQETEVETAPAAVASAVLGIEVRYLALTEIYVGDNYRTSMSAEGIAELAEGIVNMGLLQPATVRPLDEPIEGKYFALVAGGRRYAAHQLAGLPTMLCNVRPMTEQQSSVFRLLENLQRENPHPADEAAAVARLTANGESDQDIAALLGKSKNVRWVAQRRAISKLPAEWLKDLRKDTLTLAAAEELARWPQSVQRRLLEKRSSYKITEDIIKQWLGKEARLLSAAPWSPNDELLYPKAGACTQCPKRSSCATLFDAPDAGKDSCLDSACWAEKLKLRTAQVIAENSTEEVPAVQLSSSYYQPPAGALNASRYSVSKKKKGTRIAVYIDGPQQGHVCRVEIHGAEKPDLTQHEKGMETRRKRLLKEASKRILAERSVALLQQPDEVGQQARLTMLGNIISEQMLRNRSALDEVLVSQLVAQWLWVPITEKTRKAMRGGEYKEWVRKQVATVAPSEAKLQELLFFSVAYHNVTGEYASYQEDLVKVLAVPQLTEGLDAAAQVQMEKEYDTKTLRARKK